MSRLRSPCSIGSFLVAQNGFTVRGQTDFMWASEFESLLDCLAEPWDFSCTAFDSFTDQNVVWAIRRCRHGARAPGGFGRSHAQSEGKTDGVEENDLTDLT